MKYVQSFYTYPVIFSSIGKGIPAKDAEGDLRNIAELEDKELETLENCEPLFRELIRDKKYRILNKLPDSYKPAATLVNEANERAAAAEAKLAALEAAQKAPESDDGQDLNKMDYKALQALAKEKGVENVNVKKADLIKAIKDAE